MTTPRKSRSDDAGRVTVNFSDSLDLIQDQIHWTRKGVSLLTKWPFQVGTEIEFAFDHQGHKHCCVGIVVACFPLRAMEGHYQTVLYFVDEPCGELVKAACDCRLSREQLDHREADFTTGNHAAKSEAWAHRRIKIG